MSRLAVFSRTLGGLAMALVLFVSRPARAEQSPPGEASTALTIGQAVATALARNRDIIAATAKAGQVKATAEEIMGHLGMSPAAPAADATAAPAAAPEKK